MLGANLRKWNIILSTVEFAYHNSMNRLIGMSPFEVVHSYKPKKPIVFIPVTHHPRVFESTSAFASHVHDLHKEIGKKICTL